MNFIYIPEYMENKMFLKITIFDGNLIEEKLIETMTFIVVERG